MSSIRFPFSPAITRALGCALVAVCLFAFSGCGERNPLVELRDLGADFKRNRNRNVELVRLPRASGDEALAYVAKLDRPETITLLDLSGTQITNDGLKHLEKLEGLETLDLTDTDIGGVEETEAEGEKHGLEYLHGLPNLSTLRIGGTNITKDELKELIARLPRLKNLDVVGQEKPQPPEPRSWKSALNFGIDLAGGTNLVYQVDQRKLEDKRIEAERRGEVVEDRDITGQVMDQMVAAVSRRLNPSGVEEITVRKVGSDRIEVIIPKASPEEIERKKRQMTRLGSLEFALLANRRDHTEAYERIQDLDPSGKTPLYREDGTLWASWRPVGTNANGTPKEVGGQGEVFPKMIPVRNPETGQMVDTLHYLAVFGPPEDRVTGDYLERAYESTDENGRLAVGFLFNTQGGFRFQRLTSQNKPLSDGFRRRLAILLDNNIHSAPSIETTISNQGQITGSFTPEEINELISVLNAGALSVPIQPEPISELTVSPLLGFEVQQSGINAILIAGGVVLLFMLVYYMFAGLVADICLILNIILVMGAMALIDATFTLPGLAGIVLTIGMAVDANVLIFERMREELNRGSSMRLAIQNGFGRALSAIVDSNLTTLITAVVLYVIGTDQVRGFAVTLFIGIVMSLFTALFFGRLIFEIWERKRWLTRLRMLSIVSPTISWRFINKWKIAVAASMVVIVVGMATFIYRGSDNFDIDFSGGTMLTFELTEPQNIEEVRTVLNKQFPDETITLEKLTREGLAPTGIDEGLLFRIRTKEADADEVEKRVIAAMDESHFELLQLEMTPKPDAVAEAIQPISEEDISAAEEAGNLSDFKDGHKVTAGFAEPLTESQIKTHFTTALGGIEENAENENAGEPKYVNLDQLIHIAPTDPVSPTEADAVGQYRGAAIWVSPRVSDEDFATALQAMQAPQFPGKNSFSSSVADDMKWSAVQAILISLIAIVAYIWFRFQRVTFGLAAVAAVVHDVFAVLGIVAIVSWLSSEMGFTYFGLEDFKINLPMIAALLTLVGYSLNDTIVVFDRIREIRGKNPALTEQMIDTSLNQTLSRTLLTSLTTWFVVAVLYAIGGAGIHGFAFCLVVGVIVGTYSSIYIASPVLLWLMNRETKNTRRSAPTEASKAAAAG